MQRAECRERVGAGCGVPVRAAAFRPARHALRAACDTYRVRGAWTSVVWRRLVCRMCVMALAGGALEPE
jgi:hypothetical protein